MASPGHSELNNCCYLVFFCFWQVRKHRDPHNPLCWLLMAQFIWNWYQYTVCKTLWRSDAIWQYRSESTLVQVMAWCLTTPSHYLNQYWWASLIWSRLVTYIWMNRLHDTECAFSVSIGKRPQVNIMQIDILFCMQRIKSVLRTYPYCKTIV